MKNKILIIVFLSLFGGISYYIYNNYIKRDPIRIIEEVYNLDLHEFDCSIELFEEQWMPNGDGFSKVILNIKNYPTNTESYLKSKGLKTVPIIIKPTSTYSIGQEFQKYLNIEKGYYLYNFKHETDGASFDLLIFDLENNKIIFRSEII